MIKINSKEKLREFGYLIGIGFPLIIGWLIPKITNHGFRVWTLFISIPLLLTGICAPYRLNKLYRIWMFIGHTMGWLNSKIILGLVFLIVLQPIALVMKVFGYDPLSIKNLNRSSYKEEKLNSKVDLTRIF